MRIDAARSFAGGVPAARPAPGSITVAGSGSMRNLARIVDAIRAGRRARYTRAIAEEALSRRIERAIEREVHPRSAA